MNVEKYLERFKADVNEPSLKHLTELQQLHLYNVPFENLDVIRREPIYLNLERIYDKIVNDQRGGYCYELNGLFHSLLTHLKYDAYLVSATVLRPNNEWAKADTHAAIIVQLDQAYLVDVGFGAVNPRVPIPLNGEAKTPIGEVYSIQQQAEQTFDLIRSTEQETRTIYRFNNVKKELVDFHEGCVFNQVSKDSTFTHTDIIALATEKGRITLRDKTLTITENGKSVQKTLSSVEEKNTIMKDIFALSLK